MRKTKFTVENGKIYEGYTDGSTWNGWECPWFTKEVAEEMMEDLESEGVKTEYNEKTDSYIVIDADNDVEDVFDGEDRETEDGKKHLYPIGAWCWIWDEVDEEYVPSAENGDYGPSNPWDAPGMNIWDFI